MKRWLLAGVAWPILMAGLLPFAASAELAELHEIAPGETAYSIARHYGVELEALARVNALRDPSQIKAGDVLSIPSWRGSVPSIPAASELPARPGIPKLSPREPGSETRIAARSAARRSGAEAATAQESPTARLSVPVVLDNQQFPPVAAEISTTELINVSPRGLAQSLQPVLSEQTAQALEALGADLRPAAELQALGVRASLNTALLAVQVDLDPSVRSGTARSLGDLSGSVTGPVILPERFALGVTGALLGRAAVNGPGEDTGTAFVNGFANVGGIDGVNMEFGAFYDLVQNDFRRDRIVLFHDDRERLMRFSAGDLSPAVPRQAGAFDTLGIGVERRYETLQPRRNIRPAGRRSFILDRPATVEIYVNGALLNRFDAPAGALNLDDIPLTSLSNEVTIIVDDALGRRELDTFSLAADVTLLAPGLTEFSLTGGLLRDFAGDGGFNYSSELAAGGSVQRGLSESLTVGGHAAISADLVNAGASAAFGALGGVASLEGAVSNASDVGAGYSVALGFRGGPFLGPQRFDQLSLRAEYYSEDFTSFSDVLGLQRLQWDVGATYNFRLDDRSALNLGGSYLRRYDAARADSSVFIGVNRRFDLANVSLTGRYVERSDGRSEFGAFISLTRAFGGRRFATATYDTITETGRVEYRRTRGLDLPEIDYRIGAVRRPGSTDATAAFGYSNSRLASEIQVESTIEGDGGDFIGGRLQSGIAFVDGRAAIGRDPGQGFYMFRTHPTLRGASVDVRSGAIGRTRGRADRFGPAVVPVLQPYRDEQLQIFAQNAPMGYNLGDGRYTVLPGARTGTSIVVGEDAFRTAVASLVDAGGEPVALAYGSVVNLDTGEQSVFFTNRTGRAAFNNLSAGRHRAEIGGIGAFTFTIAGDDEAFVSLGDITLEQD